MSANALAKALNVPAPRINDIVRERRGISADTALRLARYFGGDAQSWLNLQSMYDLRLAEIAAGKRIEREVAVMERAARVGPCGPAAAHHANALGYGLVSICSSMP